MEEETALMGETRWFGFILKEVIKNRKRESSLNTKTDAGSPYLSVSNASLGSGVHWRP